MPLCIGHHFTRRIEFVYIEIFHPSISIRTSRQTHFFSLLTRSVRHFFVIRHHPRERGRERRNAHFRIDSPLAYEYYSPYRSRHLPVQRHSFYYRSKEIIIWIWLWMRRTERRRKCKIEREEKWTTKKLCHIMPILSRGWIVSLNVSAQNESKLKNNSNNWN